MSESAADLPELFQIRLSMFPEKVRWVLDLKQVPHIRHSLMPGPHIPVMKKLSGSSMTPVLRHRGQVIRESAAIVRYIEEQWPRPPVYPDDPELRQQALAMEFRLGEIGVHLRRAFFHVGLKEGAWASKRFSWGFPRAQALAFRAAFPAIRIAMAQNMKISPARARESLAIARDAAHELGEQVSKLRDDRPFLVGGRFSVADITAATVFHPIALPPEYPVPRGEPLPAAIVDWLESWKDHPLTAWVARIYREQRPPSAAVQDGA